MDFNKKIRTLGLMKKEWKYNMYEVRYNIYTLETLYWFKLLWCEITL